MRNLIQEDFKDEVLRGFMEPRQENRCFKTYLSPADKKRKDMRGWNGFKKELEALTGRVSCCWEDGGGGGVAEEGKAGNLRKVCVVKLVPGKEWGGCLVRELIKAQN